MLQNSGQKSNIIATEQYYCVKKLIIAFLLRIIAEISNKISFTNAMVPCKVFLLLGNEA